MRSGGWPLVCVPLPSWEVQSVLWKNGENLRKILRNSRKSKRKTKELTGESERENSKPMCVRWAGDDGGRKGEIDREKEAGNGIKERKNTGRVGGKDGGSLERRNKWEMVEMIDLAQPCLANSAHPAGFSHTHAHTYTHPLGRVLMTLGCPVGFESVAAPSASYLNNKGQAEDHLLTNSRPLIIFV